MTQECPICGFEGASFAPGGPRMRPRAMCPRCHSLERQRLAWLFMAAETDLLAATAARRFLHFSPDPSLQARLGAELHIGQLTADLDPRGVMVAMDITDIRFPDETFDAVYCSHVLEHVPDDRRAMREMLRVLAPDGWAIVQVPLWDAVTDEDPTVTSEAERTARFGQRDHVRRYGRDFGDRLAQAGFQVTVDPFARRIGAAAVARFGLTLQEEIYLARRPRAPGGGSVHDPLTELLSPAHPAATTGRVERIGFDGVVTGWAWAPGDPQTRLTVRAILDGHDVGGDVASRHRPSLQESGIGDGRYCFRIALPAGAEPGRPHRLRIEAEGGRPLPPSTAFTTELADAAAPWYAIDVAAVRR